MMDYGRLSLTLLLLVLAACASPPQPAAYDPSHSLAYNVAAATYMTKEDRGPLFDVEAAAPSPDIDNPSNTINNLANTAGVFAGLSGQSFPGLTSIGTIAFSFGYSLIGPQKLKHPAINDQVITWMPADLVPDQDTETARDKMLQLLRDSLEGVLSYAKQNTEWKAEEFSKKKLIRTEFQNPQTNDRFGVAITVAEPLFSVQPEWLGAKPSFQFRPPSPGNTSSVTMHNITIYITPMKRNYEGIEPWLPDLNPEEFKEYVGLNLFEIYQALSEKLPEWAYIYVAPRKEWNNPPLVYSQGKPNFFIIPESTSTNP